MKEGDERVLAFGGLADTASCCCTSHSVAVGFPFLYVPEHITVAHGSACCTVQLQRHPKHTVAVLAVCFLSCRCCTCCPAVSCTMQLGHKCLCTLPPRLLQCCCRWLYPSQGYSSNSTSIYQRNSSRSRCCQRHNSSSAHRRHRWYRSHCYSHPISCCTNWHNSSSSCDFGASPCRKRAHRTGSGHIHVWTKAPGSAV